MPPKRHPAAQPAGESHSKVPRFNETPFHTPYMGSTLYNNIPQPFNFQSQPFNFQSQPFNFQSQPPPSSLGHAIRQPPRESWAVDDEDVPEPNRGADISSYELYGTLDSKIVGIRYYQGVVNVGEKVICRREPTNPHDRNAIRVDNVMRTQIGHISRRVAAKIAPYVDRDEIILEGVIMGEKGTWECPVRLYFYGTSDAMARLQLEERLKNDKLIKATQLKRTRNHAEAQRDAAMRLRANATTVGLPGDEGGLQGDVLQDLLVDSEAIEFRGDLSSIDVFAQSEDSLSKLPKALQPSAIKSKLLPYQLQGLAWMIAKENPQPPALGSKNVVQLWKRTGRGNFINLASNHITQNPPKLASGGVLADDMGLGKTLQIISLIMSSVNEGPTLIVAPLGVMSNWEQQIWHHVKDVDTPTIFKYHKPGSYSGSDLERFNIVVTTYDKVRSDQVKNGPLFSVNWRRIILDEAHAIRNYSTARAKAVFDLKAESRWMLSGTPIVNSPKDFLSALKFLQITGGIEEARFFLQLIDKPLSNGPRGQDDKHYKFATKLFQLLTTDLCLRRRKDMKFVDLKLPPKTEYLYRIKFRQDEKDMYGSLLTETTEMLEQYRHRNERGGGAEIGFTSVLEKLLRLRQMCCHWTLCGGQVKDILRPLEGQKVVSFTRENLKILQQALLVANNEGEECPICTDAISMHDPIITACKHRFGRACILEAFKHNSRCPMCRQRLAQDSIVGLEPVDLEDKFDGDTRSSKTEALEKILNAKLKDPKSKIVVFSQWTSFLSIIAKLLDESGHKYCRLEGSMTIARRDESIEALNDDPDTRIMLASLAASGVGLNLVAADTVILVDSWWAPAIEDQAIDRVHRLGQTRPTTVWKLVMDGTIEERVLSIQSKKRRFANLALNDKVREQKETSHLEDVMQLLS
ncbi:SNF2 family N-terminal domain-containing protein [Annulohypoxylon maeteangense]|uniref:SNF2 family N-terminal domain-containing protein n=1 Tax=Annulohypoxylon maeteangense TaxID=1927788 RepID=UPI0020079A2A|nr:SNF2 family N-terminal domain-containing protein [Annulohypoxylon maeteangense]KAI0882796.1 SNF2 family N-terminal domain-containing protein [Annulohypoxylon maeteangense]